MPANSGAISGTVAHRHELSGATGGYLAEGSTGFSGGLLNEVLTNDGTDIPVWAAAAPAPVSSYTFLDYFEQTVSSVSMDLSWSSLSFDDISSVYIYLNVEPAYDPTDIELQFSQGGSLITTSTYYSVWSGIGSRTPGNALAKDSWLIHEARDRKRVGGWVTISGATSLVTTADRRIIGGNSFVTDSAPAGSLTCMNNTTQTSPQTIDGVKLSCYNTGGSASAFEAGSYIAAFSTSTT